MLTAVQKLDDAARLICEQAQDATEAMAAQALLAVERQIAATPARDLADVAIKLQLAGAKLAFLSEAERNRAVLETLKQIASLVGSSLDHLLRLSDTERENSGH